MKQLTKLQEIQSQFKEKESSSSKLNTYKYYFNKIIPLINKLIENIDDEQMNTTDLDKAIEFLEINLQLLNQEPINYSAYRFSQKKLRTHLRVKGNYIYKYEMPLKVSVIGMIFAMIISSFILPSAMTFFMIGGLAAGALVGLKKEKEYDRKNRLY